MEKAAGWLIPGRTWPEEAWMEVGAEAGNHVERPEESVPLQMGVQH